MSYILKLLRNGDATGKKRSGKPRSGIQLHVWNGDDAYKLGGDQVRSCLSEVMRRADGAKEFYVRFDTIP
jgi:hypothetical protein